jgi:MFS transporter, DHA1 family, inner membrane transport protein
MSQPENTSRLSLWMLLLGNFVIGTGVLLPAGLLNDFSSDFSISASKAGLMLFVGGVVVAIGAPVFAALTSGIERRFVLTAALILYAIGHAAAALAPGFELQLFIRAVTLVGAAVFTPQAASTVGLLVPLEKRAGAIAFIFIGWSAAAVAGIPLSTLLSAMFGWRMVYTAMAGLSAFAALCVWWSLKPKLFAPALSTAAWKETFSTPLLWIVFLVTLFSMSGQFTMFGYIAPLLRDGFAASPAMISVMFAIVGVSGVFGNTLASRVVAQFGIDRVVALGLLSLCMGFLGLLVFWGQILPALAAGVFWGLGSFSSNSLQQSRLVSLAPHLAAATVSLNTSVVYLGQSIGSVAGGRMIDAGHMPATPVIALGFMLVALGLSIWAARLTRRTVSATSAKP